MMVSEANTTPAAARIERYRQAERALWDHYGLEPRERFVDLDAPRVRLRVLEVGSGEPVVFIPGTGGTGPYWGPLVRELQGVRCLMLDRPGWGLSAAIDYSKYEYKTLVADVLRGVLDALGLDRAHVVGASIGEVWALRLAQAHPSRVSRIVLLGGGPLLPETRAPIFIRLLASPLGAFMVRIPQKPGMVRSQLRGVGHGASLDAGRMDEYIMWRVAFQRDTDSMRNERNMVRAILSWLRGWRPGLTFEDAEFAGIQQPALYVYGAADPVATIDIVKRVVGLLPRAELRLVEGGGHLPWFDDPVLVGSHVSRFLVG